MESFTENVTRAEICRASSCSGCNSGHISFLSQFVHRCTYLRLQYWVTSGSILITWNLRAWSAVFGHKLGLNGDFKSDTCPSLESPRLRCKRLSQNKKIWSIRFTTNVKSLRALFLVFFRGTLIILILLMMVLKTAGFKLAKTVPTWTKWPTRNLNLMKCVPVMQNT